MSALLSQQRTIISRESTAVSEALAPGLPCFTCCGLLDFEEIRRDMLNADERKRNPYIVGGQNPRPQLFRSMER